MIDVLVLGSGVAGLSTAIGAARAGLRTVVITKGELANSATRYAQGGVAAALETPDSPALHLADTLAAGAGLCDRDAVEVLVTEGPGRVRDLVRLGAEFDTTDGKLEFTREGGHSLARIVHAGGDATGLEIERALVAGVRETAAEVLEGWFATDVILEPGTSGPRAGGVLGIDASGQRARMQARHVVIATGGAGQLYSVTTNPALSTGDGIAMALRAGAAAADVEFMQFHPTALHHPAMPRPLLSEALRGEGAVLRDEHGAAFMEGEHPQADLAPRDVVSRAISSRLRDRGLDHLWLDATPIEDFPARFPSIWTACRNVGLDPQSEWLPVAPAAHYLSGGVCTDLDGATTLRGLWAVGEAADCGVHGANRLASNSLLDGLVFGGRVVDAIASGKDAPDESGVLRSLPLPLFTHGATTADPASPDADVSSDAVHSVDIASSETEVPGRVDTQRLRGRLQHAMTTYAGVLRDAQGLATVASDIDSIATDLRDARGRSGVGVEELANLVDVGTALVTAARARTESRGTHSRLDYLDSDPAFEGRFVIGGADAVTFVPHAHTTPA